MKLLIEKYSNHPFLSRLNRFQIKTINYSYKDEETNPISHLCLDITKMKKIKFTVQRKQTNRNDK